MKKNIFSIMLIVLILMFISGCDRRVEYEFLQPNENISKIDFVLVGNDNNFFKKEDPYEFPNQTTVIKELGKEEFEEFLIDFNKLNCYKYFTDPGRVFPGYQAVKITYINGDFELINVDGQASYKNGKYKEYGYYYFHDEPFQELINKYFK